MRQPKRPRPHINMATKVSVAWRQLSASGRPFPDCVRLPLDEQLPLLLKALFGDEKAHLDHDPALINRPYTTHRAVTDESGQVRLELIEDISDRYTPHANDANHLIWRTAAVHDIKTRVRGEHGQHSDLGLRRKLKRIAKNRDPNKRKTRWPKRPFPKRRKPL